MGNGTTYREARRCVPPVGYAAPAHARGGSGRGFRRRKRGRLALAVALVLAAVLAVVAGVTARYVMEQDRDAEMVAAGFHMSSDTLKEVASGGEAPTYTVVCEPDGTFAVNLYNWEVENEASISEVDVTYEVAVEHGSPRESDPVTSGGSVVYADGGLRKLVAGTPGDGGSKVAHVLHVRPKRPGVPVTVTVTATAPYPKVLKATFSASAPLVAASATPNVVQSGLTVTTGSVATGITAVTVQTNQYEGSLALTWGEGLTPAAEVVEAEGWSVHYESREATLAAQRLSTYRFEFVGAAPAEATATMPDSGGAAVSVSRKPT